MKSTFYLFCIFFCLSSVETVIAQNNNNADYLKEHPINDYKEVALSNYDTIPDFNSKQEKLMLTGTIYLSDGITPAKDVILFIEQPDDQGNFDLREENDKRYVRHSGLVKTDADGKYTFYTFVPGNDRRYNQPQQIFPVIKEPLKEPYEINTFLFDEDPLLSKRCKKKIAKQKQSTRILKPKMVDGILVAERNIILNP
ncbi:peptidase associated/transthyretin-like domain-containing protein [Winogradskyella alexanderae]|uniref:Intradiol ring-cleavage dioxygenases domain-containing protein n=1 Tax=Winogradskyella alexanderae TaxID=2877123 RepID=A0ABS7XRU4_9FLAO|nr:hypothetical protein [Winogradskyella alexanderae]MCA0132732.1 hypothetical protein [Winogradskyella alexanderae]